VTRAPSQRPGWLGILPRAVNPGADRMICVGEPADLPAGEAERSRFTYRVARADIGLGRWAEAESRIAGVSMTPASSPQRPGDGTRRRRPDPRLPVTSLLAEIKYFSGNVDTAAGLVRAQRMAATNLPYTSRERYLDGKEIPTGG
jgi:hypothetical protein